MVNSSNRNYGQVSSTCNYNSLSSYCNCTSNMAPVPSQVPSQATVVVPVFGAISYDSLTRSGCIDGQCDSSGCGGYVSISQAYDTGNCSQYTTRSCGC